MRQLREYLYMAVFLAGLLSLLVVLLNPISGSSDSISVEIVPMTVGE